MIANLLNEVASFPEGCRELHLRLIRGEAFLVGDLEFRAARGERELIDSYKIEVHIPKGYPFRPPVVKEVGGRIPHDVNHHVYPDGTLCFGPGVEVLRVFKRNPTLLGYIQHLLIPHLFWHTHNERHCAEALSAYSHGSTGIDEYRAETDLLAAYCEIFAVTELDVVLRFLELACEDTIDYSLPCPCKSDKTLSACHAKTLQGLLAMPYLKATALAQDYWHLKENYREGKKSVGGLAKRRR